MDPELAGSRTLLSLTKKTKQSVLRAELRCTHRVFVQRLCQQGLTKYGFAVVGHFLLLFHSANEAEETADGDTITPL